ncbi:MAG: hypothetical protein QOK57_10290 [Nitrososphaeraceae archaeon]|nr:hypothetical protein [Nitrososphaeraceae archaeon]
MQGMQVLNQAYSNFVNCSIEELKDMHEKFRGSKEASYYRDKDAANLRTKTVR